MNRFSDIVFLPGGIMLRAGLVLLSSLQLYLSVVVIRQRRKTAAALNMLAFLADISFLILLLDGTFGFDAGSDIRTVWPKAVTLVYGLPWPVILAAELGLTAVSAVLGMDASRHGRTMLQPSAVKEAVDLLPAGILFSDRSGAVRMANLRMNDYAVSLTGKRLSDADAFFSAVRERGEEQEGKEIVRMDDGRTVLFTREEVLVEGRPYTEISASDITEQARATEELREINHKLLDVQTRMKAYQVRAAEMFTDQELLSARIAVHDGLGSLLLHCRYYFEHPEEIDEGELLRMMKETNRYLLREAEEPEQAHDYVEEALRMAKGIGIRVILDGEIPDSGPVRDILGRAIGECAVNAVKHAGATKLSVRIRQEDETAASSENRRLCVVISNDGLTPEKTIREAGGLRSLRQIAEESGGEMIVESAPEFCVRLTFSQQAQ